MNRRMSPPAPLSARAWIAVPLLALGFLLWSHLVHRARVEYVTGAVSGDAVVSPGSPTGYAGEIRELIVPEQNSDSAHWIAQTQHMFARGEWRVRQISYENAPLGREVMAPSPYRWWLGLVAQVDQFISARPLGQSVERAALQANPLWHLLLLAAAVAFTAWRFGVRPASLLSLGLAILFPFAAGFSPGIPDDRTLARSCAFASVLVLLAGIRSAHGSRRWFFAAGVAGGLGLWVSVAEQVPVILGISLGAVSAAWLSRRKNPETAAAAGSPAPGDWLAWALGGAVSSLVFYLAEYYPTHLGAWQLQTIHPLYSLAWLGLGTVLFLVTQSSGWNYRKAAGALLAVAAVAPIPVLMIKAGDRGFLAADIWSYRLTRLTGSPEATNLASWLIRDGMSGPAWAALLPLLTIVPAGWLIWRKETTPTSRTDLVITLGPVLVGLALACWQLGRWSGLDAILLVMLVAITLALRDAPPFPAAPRLWSGFLVLLLAPGLFQLWPSTKSPKDVPLNEAELSGLIERDLAHWLARHTETGKAVVLAPPNETTALYYYGGLRGVGTLSWENKAGIGAAVRIFSATSPQEALALIEKRGVTHIVIPSWDQYLNEYLRLGAGQVDLAFLSGLRNWALPPWLRPVAYQLPAVAGYEGQSVAVFEVVEEQDEATSLSRLAEYFVEVGQLDFAAQVSQSLQRFPADLGAEIARAQVAMAHRDGAGLANVMKSLAPQLSAGVDRALPWDRRVGLTVVLAQGGQMDLAREQVRRCLAEATGPKLRSASTSSLYRLLLLAKRFELELSDTRLRELGRDLLPAEMRSRIQQ